MKKLITLAVAMVFASPSFAILIDFNSIGSSTVISGVGAVTPNFTISAVAGGSSIVRAVNGPNGTIGGLQDGDANQQRTGYRIDFNVGGVSSVSVDIGDFNQDSENIYLSAYNSSNVLLSTTSFALPSSQQTYQTLSVSGSNISYILFGGDAGNNGFLNSVFFDNVNYNQSVGAPDRGNTLLLLAGVLLGLAARGRRNRA